MNGLICNTSKKCVPQHTSAIRWPIKKTVHLNELASTEGLLYARPLGKCFMFIFLRDPHNNPVRYIIISIVQMPKLRFRKLK